MKIFSCNQIYWRSTVLCLLLAFALSACSTTGGNKTPLHTSSCTMLATNSTGKGPNAAILANIPLPGQPFKAVATDDGKWIFVSVDTNSPASSGIAVLHRQGSQICFQHMLSLPGAPLGMALTRDNSILVVADYSNVAFVNVTQAEHGTWGALLGSVPERSSSSTIEVTLSQDEHYIFAANENDGTVSAINFQRIRAHDFGANALLGQIRVGIAPVGIIVSPDNHYLYVTSEIDNSSTPPQGIGGTCSSGYPPGVLSVASIARVAQDITHAIIARINAGCGPVRIVLSPTGNIAWVTARGSNAVLAFNTAQLLAHTAHARLTSVAVGPAPVGMALIDRGKVLVVANSNRFLAPQSPQTLTVLDTQQALMGKTATLASIKVGAFPRELELEANGQTLLLTNYDSDTLSIIDVTKLPGPTQSQANTLPLLEVCREWFSSSQAELSGPEQTGIFL